MGTSSENWGLGFGQEGAQPTGNVSLAISVTKKLDHYNAKLGDSLHECFRESRNKQCRLVPE